MPWSTLVASTLPKGVRVSNPLLGDEPKGTHAVFDYLASPSTSVVDILKQAQAANGALLILDKPEDDLVTLLKVCGYTPFTVRGCDSLMAANYELPEKPWLVPIAKSDGAHRHAVVLPDGQVVLTEYDGAHSHAYYEGVEMARAVDESSKTLAEKDDLAIVPGTPGYKEPEQNTNLTRTRTRKPVIVNLADLAKADLISGSANVIKKEDDTEERYILGVVLEPNEVDSQGDTISAEVIRTAAHKYMEDFGNIGLQHQTFVNGKIKTLESYILPVTAEIGGQVVKAGTWLMGFRVLDDSIWTAVKEGLLTGLSIGGMGTRVPAA